MTRENYLLYVEKTILSYSTKVKKYLVNRFIEIGIAIKSTKMLGRMNIEGIETVDITEKSFDEALLTCLKENEKALMEFEKWEFEKDYKYSVLFSCDKFNELFESVKCIKPLETCEKDNVFNTLNMPVAFHDEERSYLKFILKYATIHPVTQEEMLLKYPILLVLHKNGELIEIRFDVLKKAFILDQEQETYASMIESIRKYVFDSFKCNLEGLNLDFMVGVAKQNDDIKLIAQYMRLTNGGYAQLEVGNNQEYMLPFIGELRTLLFDFNTELEKVPDVKDALEQFMFEKDEMSDYPWIEVLWEDDIKTRSIHVKFVFNYMNKEYALIQHYYNNVLVGMERMNYVIKYIVTNRSDNTE